MGKRSRNAHIPSMTDEELELRMRELHGELHRREQSLRNLKAEVGEIYGNSEVRSAKTLVFRAEYMIEEVKTEKLRRSKRKTEASEAAQQSLRDDEEAERVAAQARQQCLGNILPDQFRPQQQQDVGPQLLYLTQPAPASVQTAHPVPASSSSSPTAAAAAFQKAFEEGLSSQALAAGYKSHLLAAQQSLLTHALFSGAAGGSASSSGSRAALPVGGGTDLAALLQASRASPAAPGGGMGASVPAAFRRQAMPAAASGNAAIPAAFLKKPDTGEAYGQPVAKKPMVSFK